jgi:hypothetical protein
MKREKCPHCQGWVYRTREGVRLTPIRAEVYDIIARAGSEGIKARAIQERLFWNPLSLNTIRVHIFEINELLEETSFQIISAPSGHFAKYYLRPRVVREVA